MTLLRVTFAGESPYFFNTYEKAKAEFDRFTQNYDGAVSRERYEIPSEGEEKLSIDTAYFPPITGIQEKLMIVSSGIHGIESYAATGIQLMILKELLPHFNREKTGILIIHGINPWGFKHKRRGTENNIDLNRSFLKDRSNIENLNPQYKFAHGFAAPSGLASWSLWGGIKHFFSALLGFGRYGKKEFRSALVSGQYLFPKGIMYGGKRSEPHEEILLRIFKKNIGKTSSFLLIDLHTGYGKRGALHPLVGEQRAEQPAHYALEVFKDSKVVTSRTKGFYKVFGDFPTFIQNSFPHKVALTVIFEFGTLDSQTTLGAIDSIRRITLENQGHHFGYSTPDDEKTIKENFLELFFPKDPLWRSSILQATREKLPQILKRYQKLVIP